MLAEKKLGFNIHSSHGSDLGPQNMADVGRVTKWWKEELFPSGVLRKRNVEATARKAHVQDS